MTANLKLAYSESKMDAYKLARLRALDEQDTADEPKLAKLKREASEAGRAITDILWARMWRNVQRKKILRGEFIMPPLEDAIDE